MQNNMNNLSFFIAKKYSLSKIIGYVAIIALTFGIACILTVSSIMNGFYDILDNKLSNIISNVIVFNVNETTYDKILNYSKNNTDNPASIKDIEKILQTQAFFTNNNKIDYLAIQNSSEYKAKKNSDLNGLTISKQYANQNNLKIGQDITLIFSNNQNKLEFLPIKINNIDKETTSVLNQIAVISKNDPSFDKVFNSNIDYSTNIQITLNDPHTANEFKNNLKKYFADNNYPKISVFTWKEIFGSILDGIAYTKQIMLIILFFMIIVATFNILATIFITIKEKQAEIAILQTMGASKKLIFKIFIMQGIIFSSIALVAGIIFSFIVCLFIADITKFLEFIFDVVLINPDNYLIDYLPTKYSLKDVLFIALFTYIINIIIAIIPAYRATKNNPVQLLRYE